MQYLRNAEYEMAMRDLFKEVSTNLFPKLDNPFLMIARVKMLAVRRESKKILMTVLSSSDSTEPVTQDAIAQVAVNDRLEIRIIKPMGSNVPQSTDRIIRE